MPCDWLIMERIIWFFPNIYNPEDINRQSKETAILECDEMFITKNFLLLTFKKYVYDLNNREGKPFFSEFIKNLLLIEKVEKTIAGNKDKLEVHYNKWEPILNAMSLGIPLKYLGDC